MKTNKHEILVLLDLKGDIINPITTAVSLAKLIDGHIHVFYVRKPIDVIESDSQLSALRTINRSYIETSNDIKNIIASMSKDFSGSISYSHTFGNIKHSILDYLKANSPDVIILGKKKIKPFNLIRNNITDFIVKNYEGAIMIAALGLLNKLLGGLFGALKIGLIISIIFIVFDTMNNTVVLVNKDDLKESILYKPIKGLAPLIFPDILKD